MNTRPTLVIGGRSDIGRAIAHRFAADGRPIQLAARRADELEVDAADISIRHGVPVTLHELDVNDLGGIKGFFDELPETPGVVVSVVGLLGDQEETARDPALADLVVRTNLTGPSVALEEAARRLAALDEDTAVIGVSSVAGDRGRARNYWYGAAKAGFTAVLSGLRQTHAASRLHVMTVKPGFVDTAMTEGMETPGALTSTPQDVAELVFKSLKRKRFVVYDWKWWIVMTIISLIPETIFRKLKF